jgi:hypothetical protein
MLGMRKEVKICAGKGERLNLMVVRAGLIAGRAAVRGRI